MGDGFGAGPSEGAPAATMGSIEGRFVALQALRWLPVGFVAPLLILLITRDLSLSQAGPLIAIYGVSAAVLELPTGGFADAIGRRLTLLLSSLVSIVFFGLVLAFQSFGGLAVALVFGGAARALDSGPLEAWFVDEMKAIDPDADLRAGLSKAGTADGIALAVGSVVGGLLPALFDGRLEAALIGALTLQVVHLVAVAVLMQERTRPNADHTAPASILRTIREASRLASANSAIRRLLAGALTIGVGLVAIETLWQVRFVALLQRDDSTVFLGVVLAVAFFGGALGSAVARRFGSATSWQVAGGASIVALAGMRHVPLAALFLVLSYLCSGAAAPLRDELMHENTPSTARSTMVSLESLVFQAGAFLSALTLPPLADRHGIPMAWVIGGTVLAVGGLFYAGVSGRAPRDPTGA